MWFSFFITWEQRKLGEVAQSFEYGLNVAAKEYDGINKYLRITDIDDVSRKFDTDNLTSPDTELAAVENYRLVDGDILFARTGASVGKSYIYRVSDGLVYFAGFLIRAKIKPEYDAEFVFQNTLSESYEKYVQITSQRSGQPGVNAQEYSDYVFYLPTYDEQQKIGAFLRNLDNFITLHQRKQNDLFLLILGKKSSSILANDWEQRKFESLAKTRRGLTYNPSHISSHGIRVLRSSNINEDTFVLSDEDVFVCQNAVKIECVKPNDILITAANGSTRLVGKHAIIVGIRENEAVHGGFMLVASSSKPFFLNAAMSAPWYLKFINLFVAGGNGAIGNLNKNDLDNQVLLVPENNEQDKIGAFFRNLDNLITLHQCKQEAFLSQKRRACFQSVEGKSTLTWEQRKLGDILQTLPFKQFLKEPEMDGKYEVIQQGGEPIIGFANGTPCTDYKDIVIFGDHTLSLYKPKQPFFVATDGVRILKGTKNVDGFFLLFLLERYKPQSEGYKRYFNILSDIECFMSYNISEQKKIGAFFDTLDNLITLHQRGENIYNRRQSW